VSVSLQVEGPGDAELISAVRGGDVDAYGELFARHVDAARRLARQLTGPADADDLVSDAFTKVLTVLQRGGGPDLAFRAYLLTAVRRLHVDKIRAGSRLRPVDDLTPFDPGLPFHDTAVAGFENAAAAKAFASLPERWQMVLWHTEVEQQKPADIAPLLGMSANSVSALAYRAREGLRQAFLSQHATDPDDVDCAWTRDHLGAYVRSGLSRRDASRVDDHLASCRACAAVYLELTEVNSGLAGILAPLLLGSAGAGYVSSGGAGTGFLSTGFSAARTWAVSHASVTAIGGILVTATAVLSIYGATHFHSKDAADLGSPQGLNQPPAASTLPTNGGDGKSGQHNGQSRGPDAAKTTLPPPTSQAPSVTPTSTPPSTEPTDTTSSPSEPTTGPTSPTTGPTSPTTGPTGPTDPGGDQITFTSTPPTNPKFGDTYDVSATSGSGHKVSFSVDPTVNHLGPACSISGSTVTFKHAGKCAISAETGSSKIARAQATQSVNVPRQAQQVTITSSAPTSPTFGDTYRVSASSDSGAPVAVSVETTTNKLGPACTVTGSTVSFDHAGKCTITANAGNDDYLPASDTQGVGVPQEAQQVTITSTAPADAVVGGPSYTATADGGASGNDVVFSPGSPLVCSVAVDGTVTFDHPGTCIVDADQSGDDDYDVAAQQQQKFDVGKGTPHLDFTLPASGKVGGSDLLTAKSSDSDGTITYSVDHQSQVCTLNQAHTTVRYHQVGACTVTATLAPTDDYTGATAVQTVNVTGVLSVSAVVDANPTIGALFGTIMSW
jgi:RNA polymerase sigma factor (sigma-70 family)